MTNVLIHVCFGSHFGISKDVGALIASFVMSAPLVGEDTLEPYCDTCINWQGAEDEADAAWICEECQRHLCTKKPCSEQHQVPHRHLYRMRGRAKNDTIFK
jgi:hypothetical protein